MKKQKGMALIVVLVLLTISLMLGLSGVQSSLINERVAGNYRAITKARMNAEYAVSNLYEYILSHSYEPIDSSKEGFVLHDGFGWDDFKEFSANNPSCEEIEGGLACFVEVKNNKFKKENGDYIVALGNVEDDDGNVIAESQPVFAMLIAQGVGSGKGVVGCEGISLGGGPQIDSYNSSYGGYGETVTKNGESFTNSLRKGGVIKTLDAQAELVLRGNSPIYGNIKVPGNISLDSGTPVYGNVYSDSYLKMNGSIYGNLTTQGGVLFGSASSMQGNVVSGGDVVVGETANPPFTISANGSVVYPDWWKWDQKKSAIAEGYKEYQNNHIPAVYAVENCDNASVFDDQGEVGELFKSIWKNSSLLSAADYFDAQGCGYCYSSQGKGFTFTGGNGNQDASVTTIGVSGEDTYLRFDEDVGTSGRLRQLVVEGNVTLIVDGDFSLGNNTQLVIMEGATLDLLVTGKAVLGGGSSLLASSEFVREVEVGGETVKRAAVSLYSAYRNYGGNPNSAGVTVSGANNSFVNILAPATDVIITGSGSIFGGVRAGKIDMRGSGDIHFDEALLEVEEGSNNVLYQLVSWN